MENSKNIDIYPADDEQSEGVYFSETIVDSMVRSAKWARFISIVGFLFSLLIAVFAFRVNALMPQLTQMTGQSGANAGSLSSALTVYYLFIALICSVFFYLLYQFATRTQAAVDNSDQPEMETAFIRLSAFFKYWGILTLVMAAMMILSVLSMFMLRGGA